MVIMMIMLLLELMVIMLRMVMLMINKDGQTSQEADLQSWPLLLHLRTAARTKPAWTQYQEKRG